MTMDLKQALAETHPSKYLNAADLRGQPIDLTISGCGIEVVDTRSQDKKIVIYFQGKSKGLALNMTNGNTIGELHGGDTDAWIGKAIQLFPTKTDFGGKQVDCIRVRETSSAPVAVAPPPASDDEPPYDPGNPDNIPF